MAPQGKLEISLVPGQPPSMVGDYIRSPRIMTKFPQFLKGSDIQKGHSIHIFHEYLNIGCSARLDQDSVKGMFLTRKRLHMNVQDLKAVFLALKYFRIECQNQTLLIVMDNSTVVAYINKQG